MKNLKSICQIYFSRINSDALKQNIDKYFRLITWSKDWWTIKIQYIFAVGIGAATKKLECHQSNLGKFSQIKVSVQHLTILSWKYQFFMQNSIAKCEILFFLFMKL